MAKLESNFKNMVIVLTGVALISAFLLASVYNLTIKPIEKAKLAKQQNAIKEVLPPYDVCKEPEKVNGLNVYKAYKNNQFVGAAVESSSANGFGGEIKVIVGFDKKGNVYNYVVLEQKETPGLGTKMVDWFKTNKGKQSIINKHPELDNLTLTKDGGTIDAITAATISSRAFIESVMTAYAAYANNSEAPDAKSGATSQIQGNGQETIDKKGEIDTVSLVPDIQKSIEIKAADSIVQQKKNTQRFKKRKPIFIPRDTSKTNENMIEKESIKTKDSVINNSISTDSISSIENGGKNE